MATQAQTLDLKLVPSRSGSMRTWDQRVILDVFSNNMVAIAPAGYLFFGSAIAVSDKLIAVRAVWCQVIGEPIKRSA